MNVMIPAHTAKGRAQIVVPAILISLAIEAVINGGEFEMRMDHVLVVQKFLRAQIDEAKMDAITMSRTTSIAVDWAHKALREDGCDTPTEHLAAACLVMTQLQGTEYDRPAWADLYLVGASVALEVTEEGGWGDAARIKAGATRIFNELRKSGALSALA